MNEVKPLSNALNSVAKPSAKVSLVAASQVSGNALPETAKVEQAPVEQPAPEVTQTQESREAVETAVARLNDYIQSTRRDLKFEVDEDSGRTIVTVFDSTTQEVIRQIPPDVVKDLAQKLNGEEPLRLFSARA